MRHTYKSFDWIRFFRCKHISSFASQACEFKKNFLACREICPRCTNFISNMLNQCALHVGLSLEILFWRRNLSISVPFKEPWRRLLTAIESVWPHPDHACTCFWGWRFDIISLEKNLPEFCRFAIPLHWIRTERFARIVPDTRYYWGGGEGRTSSATESFLERTGECVHSVSIVSRLLARNDIVGEHGLS